MKLIINKGLVVVFFLKKRIVIQIFRNVNVFAKTWIIWDFNKILFLNGFGSFAVTFLFISLKCPTGYMSLTSVCFVFCRAEKHIAQMNYCVVFPLVINVAYLTCFVQRCDCSVPFLPVEVKGDVEST